MRNNILFILALFCSTLSHSQTYVNINATGANDGSSWTDAYTDLQAAMDAASTGDAIWIAAGTYLPTEAPDGSNTNSRNRAFHLNKNLTIYGGFTGTETMLSERNWEANSTILSGDFSGNDTVSGSGSTLSIAGNGENAYHVFITSGLDSTTLIDGLTIQGGNANGAAFSNISYDGNNISKRSGGGMNNFFSSPRISNSNFNGNAADLGGGMDNEGSSPRISNTSFSRNIANSNGGGMDNFNSSPNISNTSFSGNSANYGGGIFNLSSSPSITNTSFSGNAATNDGGGMYNFSSPGSSISNTSFSGNTANRGGGMYNSNSFPIVNNTVFYENTAATDPDIFGNIDSISSHNASDGTGGGIGSGTGFIDLSSVASTTLFVNVDDADGPDGIWRTADDGLIPAAASPLTNTGSNTLLPADATDLDNDGDVTEVIPYDSTGVPRIFDGTVDVGAYETVPPCVRVNRLYVNVAATGNNTGESWANAFTDLQTAMDCATAGKEIWVAAGTYLPTDAPDGTTSSGATDRNNAFHLNKNLKIYGGFDGTETLLSQRDWEANSTTLSGDFNGDDVVSGSGSTLTISNTIENAYHVFITTDLNSTTLIDGFTMKGGNADGSGNISYDGIVFFHSNGGGIYNNDSSPSITNTTFRGNKASFGGGGI